MTLTPAQRAALREAAEKATNQDAFESVMATSNYPDIADIALAKLPDGNYKSQNTFAGWQGWQMGARAAILALLDEIDANARVGMRVRMTDRADSGD